MSVIFRNVCLPCLFLLAISTVHAQELILPLGGNPVLEEANRDVSNMDARTKKSIQAVMLELPIVDDFSYDSIFPSSAIWANNFAFVNRGYGDTPPTLGVATLDAVNAIGTVYPNATLSPSTFNADSLTSHPVNLSYPASDSIYLSFYYQPGGLGLVPLPHDSLCLDFYDPNDSIWINVWRAAGDTAQPFRQVMIPITNDRFLQEGFRFSFRNKASLPKNNDYRDKRGNVDHWHVDYVRLDRNRFRSDTVIRDVAFSQTIPSMLRDYENIPWDHFETGYNTIYLPFISMNYYNNDSATRNVTRYMQIYDEVWDETYNPGSPTAQDILPGTAATYDITSIYPFQFSRGDTASYRIKTWLRTDDFDNKINDTITRVQRFKDYFAYDDGTAERAYGLRGGPAQNGLIALKFESYIADELGGVDVYFTQLKDSLNFEYFFKFMVWEDDDGKPGALIYDDPVDRTVVYSTKLNRFKRFHFKETVPVDGTFYVGIFQYNQFMLNIGLDINKPLSGNLLYNLGTGWQESEAPGTPMIRPYVRRSYSPVSEEKTPGPSLSVYPNPASAWIRIELPENKGVDDLRMILFDITGKVVASYDTYQPEIPVGTLEDGIYLLSVSSSHEKYKTVRIVIRNP